MTIKMSEVFELPVKKAQGGVLPFLRDSNPMCNTIFVGNDDHVDATVIAINAYDANQQEIAELNLTIIRMKHTLEVIANNPGWNDHHCRAMKILEEYSEHKTEKGK